MPTYTYDSIYSYNWYMQWILQVYNTATDQKAAKVEKQRVLHEQLSAIEDQLTTITRQMKDKINRMVESVEHKVQHYGETIITNGMFKFL